MPWSSEWSLLWAFPPNSITLHLISLQHSNCPTHIQWRTTFLIWYVQHRDKLLASFPYYAIHLVCGVTHQYSYIECNVHTLYSAGRGTYYTLVSSRATVTTWWFLWWSEMDGI
jgi:hypothetical protein